VQREPAPEITNVSGLRVPDSARERPDVGIVLEVGSDVKDWKIKQRVLFPKWCGFQLTIPNDDRDLLVIFEDEVWLAI
jgi:co-chaperonin GroES (HSP10)